MSEDDAAGTVAEVFEEIRQARNLARVPSFWRAIAHYPEYLRQERDKLRAIMASGVIDPKLKETVAVAASATDNCDHCLRSHADALRALGATDAELVELLAVVDYFNGSNAVASGLKVEYEPPVFADRDGRSIPSPPASGPAAASG